MTRSNIVTLLMAGLYLAIITAYPTDLRAAGLNTDVALTPPEGGTIVRMQSRYLELSDDPTPMGREASVLVHPVTIVHGLTSDFTVLGTVPLVYQDVEFASGTEVDEFGVGDVTLLAKYRFFQDDQPGITTRWAAIGGLEAPTFDEPFSSESVDPIIGTVWTHQRRDWWVDWDVLYKFNTAGGVAGDDELRADAAVSYRLFSGESSELGPWGLYAIGEINAKYITDGSTQVFGSPGIQFITPQWILEAGVQLPIHQDMKSPRLETDFVFVFSLRFQF